MLGVVYDACTCTDISHNIHVIRSPMVWIADYIPNEHYDFLPDICYNCFYVNAGILCSTSFYTKNLVSIANHRLNLII